MSNCKIPSWRSWVVLALGGLTLWGSLTGEGPTSSTESGINLDLPSHLGLYWGIDEPIALSEKTLLPPDTEFAKKNYELPDGKSVHCEIVLSGSEKRSIHRPEVCLPGQGWTINAGQVIPVALKDGNLLHVMKLTLTREVSIAQNDRRTVTLFFLYWFVGKDKTTPYHWDRILLTSWDRIIHHTNHRWAYIIASAPVTDNLQPNGLNAEQTLDTIKDFIREMAPVVIKPDVKIN